MSASQRIALIALCALAGCGNGSPASTSPTAAPNLCTTGTQVVLVSPIPGSTAVPTGTTTLIIASMGGIIYQNAALALLPSNGAPSAPRALVGPVAAPSASPSPSPTATPAATPAATPTPAPTPTPVPPVPLPFANPTYYQSNGFTLSPNLTYTVEIASTDASCANTPIIGATFST